MRTAPTAAASWKGLLQAPPPAAHIAQVYDSDQFLARAVAHFAAEGLERGEAVLLTGTAEHLAAIRAVLRALGADADAACARRQLTYMDAREGLRAITVDGALDEARYLATAGAALAAADDPRFARLRWWGEMTQLLHEAGDTAGAMRAEALIGEIGNDGRITVLCSFSCDRFDPGAYDGVLGKLCCTHSHVIPADDYVRHRLAVNEAIAEVLGGLGGAHLHSLSRWQGPPCELPSSQALLFWLRETMPAEFPVVLARAKASYARGQASQP